MFGEKFFKTLDRQNNDEEVEKEMSRMSPEFQAARANVPLEELGSDEQASVARLEELAGALFDDKGALLSAFQDIEKFMPKELLTTKSGRKRPFGAVMQELYDNREKYEELISTAATESGENNPNWTRLKIKDAKEKSLEKFAIFMAEFEKHKAKDDVYARIKEYGKAGSEEEKKTIYDRLPEELRMLSRYKNFILEEFIDKKREIEDYNREIRFSELRYDELRSNPTKSIVADVEDEQNLLKKLITGKKELVYSSPEAYLYETINRLREAKNVIDAKGAIIETPFVKAKLERLSNYLKAGRPVFIHGELGSGKSELAKHAVRTRLSEDYYARWEEGDEEAGITAHPRPTGQEELQEWEKERARAAEPYLISGHKNIDISDFFARNGVRLSEEQSPEEQMKILDAAVEARKKEAREAGREISAEELADFKDIWKEHFKNQVEIAPVVGLFYRAMQEGRPIILDEINAIPHTALIALNDLLTLKAGAEVTPILPGMKRFRVRQGFAVIATGNWKPEDGKSYFGRQGLDAAFLSRFGVISYDYLPERLEGITASTDDETIRQEKAESESFDIMAASLLDESLGIKAPAGTMRKLRGLAQAARIIQNIFSEKKEGNEEIDLRSLNKKMAAKRALSENVLSIRHLLPIIAEWKNSGFNFSLDHYILDSYIDRSSGAHPAEKLLLYKIMQERCHLFSPDEGWPDALDKGDPVKGETEALSLDPDQMMRQFDKITGDRNENSVRDNSIKLEYTPTRQVIEEIFGPIPKRAEIRKNFFETAGDGGEKEDYVLSDEYEDAVDGIKSILEKIYKEIKKDRKYRTDKKDQEIVKKIKALST